MKTPHIHLVFAGHIDHGKSTLIGRILYDTGNVPPDKIEEIQTVCEALGKEMELGYLMDHLQEEREQGITIETAQTFFTWNDVQYIIIDAPGHVEFIRNMVTGASKADAAILIVDATEGVKEQTRRHAFLLHLIGITRVIAVVNKMDLINYDEAGFIPVRDEISRVFSTIGLSPVSIIPISAKLGVGVSSYPENTADWYTGPTLFEAISGISAPPDATIRPFRMTIQDVYNFKKRIPVGKVISGTLRTGDEITALPSGQQTKVSSVEIFQKDVLAADAGSAAGLTTADKIFLERGSVLSDPIDIPLVTDRFIARLFWMSRLSARIGEDFMLNCGTGSVRAHIESIYQVVDTSALSILEGTSEIRNLEVADVMIQCEKPVVVEPFFKTPEIGRFILVRDEPVAGGIILGERDVCHPGD